MSSKIIEEMFAQTERGFPACSKFSLENGITVCTQSNMRKSVCEHTCDDGYILWKGSYCVIKREACSILLSPTSFTFILILNIFYYPILKVGDYQQKCLCDRVGCQWGANGLNFLQVATDFVDPLCKPAESVNFCPGLTATEVPTGVTASCLGDRYDSGSRCQLECSDPGQAFNGKIFDKETW